MNEIYIIIALLIGITLFNVFVKSKIVLPVCAFLMAVAGTIKMSEAGLMNDNDYGKYIQYVLVAFAIYGVVYLIFGLYEYLAGHE